MVQLPQGDSPRNAPSGLIPAEGDYVWCASELPQGIVASGTRWFQRNRGIKRKIANRVAEILVPQSQESTLRTTDHGGSDPDPIGPGDVEGSALAPPHRPLDLHFLDVGQGDSTLVVFPNGSAWVLDANDDPAERKYAADKIRDIIGEDRKVRAILSHPHKDHACGFVRMIGYGMVRELVVPDGVTAELPAYWLVARAHEENIPCTRFGNGSVWGEGRCRVFGLCKARAFSDKNKMSIVLGLACEGTLAVFPGDLPSQGSVRMTREFVRWSHEMADPTARVIYKVAHHGSQHSDHVAFTQLADEVLAVVSCDDDGQYGHPHVSVVQHLSEATRHWRTDCCGDVRLIISPDGAVAAEVPLCRSQEEQLTGHEWCASSHVLRRRCDPGEPRGGCPSECWQSDAIRASCVAFC
jgi:competence protein ComEC